MVSLTRIYTRTGDGGQTRLSDMSLADKADVRVAAYGVVDEAYSAIGVALATGELPEDVAAVLRLIQNEMFDLGADLSNPLAANPAYEPLRVTQDYVDRLEQWCDSFGDPLPKLRSFILPGGTLAAAYLHMARTITRRAERSAWRAVAAYGTSEAHDDVPGGVSLLAVRYLNRLSDLLFILTRVVSGTDGEVLWTPGGDRVRPDRNRPPAPKPGDGHPNPAPDPTQEERNQ
jgi:cob(I)alamin adenosyltransferase